MPEQSAWVEFRARYSGRGLLGPIEVDVPTLRLCIEVDGDRFRIAREEYRDGRWSPTPPADWKPLPEDADLQQLHAALQAESVAKARRLREAR